MSKPRLERAAAAAIVLAAGALLTGTPARAEFPPEGFVVDPNNPAKADKITVERVGSTLIKAVSHYYFDCRVKKWVFVSEDLWRGEGANEEFVPPGTWTKDGKYVPGSNVGGHPDLDSSPYPPGATKQGDNPNQRYNPTNSDTYNYDPKTDTWTDSFTGRVISTKLCPCPPAEVTCPEKSEHGGGLNLGIGIGFGSHSEHHDTHRSQEKSGSDGKKPEEKSDEKSNDNVHDEDSHEGGTQDGGKHEMKDKAREKHDADDSAAPAPH